MAGATREIELPSGTTRGELLVQVAVGVPPPLTVAAEHTVLLETLHPTGVRQVVAVGGRVGGSGLHRFVQPLTLCGPGKVRVRVASSGPAGASGPAPSLEVWVAGAAGDLLAFGGS